MLNNSDGTGPMDGVHNWMSQFLQGHGFDRLQGNKGDKSDSDSDTDKNDLDPVTVNKSDTPAQKPAGIFGDMSKSLYGNSMSGPIQPPDYPMMGTIGASMSPNAPTTLLTSGGGSQYATSPAGDKLATGSRS